MTITVGSTTAPPIEARSVTVLWGGRSGLAVDCSGFTELVHRLHGMVIPRDTGDQARAGRSVSLSALHLADLVLFREAV